MTLKTELELLKKDVSDMKHIHSRLDTAITKLTDVSNCINKILAVHEEKLARQEEEIVQNEKEIKKEIQELHSRVTSNYKEIVTLISKHNSDDIERFHQLQRELSNSRYIRKVEVDYYRWFNSRWIYSSQSNYVRNIVLTIF